MPREGKPLNPKQRKFVEEYVIDGNAVKAYFQAYGRTNSNGIKRSYQGAAKSSQQLLQNPVIIAEIKAAEAEYIRRSRMSKARVVKEVVALAMSDAGDVFKEGDDGMPTPKNWSEVPPAARKAIQTIKIKPRAIFDGEGKFVKTVNDIEYKFAPKGPELDKLCKKLGFYRDEPTGGGTESGGTDLHLHPSPAPAAPQPDEPVNVPSSD